MNIAEYLARLGITNDELLGMLWIDPQTDDRNTAVLPRDTVESFAAANIPNNCNAYLAPNPTRGPARINKGRGKESDVTRVAAIYADLDVKDGACPTSEAAQQLVEAITEAIGEPPAVMIYSGGGLQPIWTLEDCSPDHGVILSRRFGRLVQAIGQDRGMKLDSVFDIARVLRIPGTLNWKYGDPREVAAWADDDSGAAIDPATLDERLSALGIATMDGDDQLGLREAVVPESDWNFHDGSQSPCNYAPVTIRGWLGETPTERHPWALKQHIRLESMRRYGCLSRDQYLESSKAIDARFLELLGGGNIRKPKRYELSEIHNEAIRRAAAKTDAELALEVGRHDHLNAAPVQPPSPGAKRASAGLTAPGMAIVTPINSAVTTQPAPTGANADISLTDKGNAMQLVAKHGDHIRYVPELKRWMHWNGNHWEVTEHESAIGAAAGDIAMNLRVLPGDKAAAAHKKRSLSTTGITGMIKLAKLEPDIQTPRDLLDARPYELNTPNGTVNLATGELLDHDRNAWHTKVTGVAHDPELACPKWDAFLAVTFQGNADIIDYIQQLAGYACIGEVMEHILAFLYGEVGQNGKSVLLKVFQQCLGNYAVTLPVSALVTGRNSHTEDTADLPGARLAVCSEVGQDTKWNEEKIKSLTGGDILSARPNYGHKFQYIPSHLIMIAANDRPRVEAGGNSFFRRFKMVPFLHSMLDDQVNERLPTELIEEEGPAILAWMVRGAVGIIARNGKLRHPESVKAATAEYAADEDDIGQWLAECCMSVTKDFGHKTGELYGSYRGWCARYNLTPKSLSKFGSELGRRGYEKYRTMTGVLRVGIKLIDDPNNLANTHGRYGQ